MTAPPQTTGARTNQLVFLAVAGLTGPFSTILLPLFIARGISAAKARQRHGLTIATIGIVEGLAQLACIATSNAPPDAADEPRPIAMVLAFVQRWGLDYLSAWSTALGFVLLLGLLLSPAIREGRWLRASLLVSALLLMLPTFIKFYQMPDLMIARSVGGRYFYVPSVLLLGTAISLAWVRRPWPMAIGALSAALMITSAIQNFRRPARAFYPDWQQKSELIGRQAITVQYAPGWTITIATETP